MPRKSLFFLAVVLLTTLTACGGGGQQAVSPTTPPIALPDYMLAGYETYHETGGIARPNNAVDVYIAYSPEMQTFMPRIITEFNRISAEGRNPATGQNWAGGERPIFVQGQDPTTGSSGTLAEGVTNAINGIQSSNLYHPTILAPSVSHWLALINYQTSRQVFDLTASVPTALSPVIIGMWESRVRAMQQTLGKQEISWDDLLAVLNSPNGWNDFGIQIDRRAVFYGHTDPTVSSTGLSTTIAEYYACARREGYTDRRLSMQAVDDNDVRGCVREIENLVRHYSARTEDFLEYIARGPEYLDFVALEETDLLCLNRGATQGDEVCNRPQERLVAIYPEDGTFWHEHPFGILNASWVTAEQQAAARIFTDFVLTPEMQRIIMGEGFRPANPDVPLEFPFVAENGVDPTQPRTVLDVPDPEVIVAIQQSWALVKKPADIMILLDVSGSMQNEDRIGQARQAIMTFMSGMEPRNRLGLMTFSDRITIWTPLDDLENVLSPIRLHVTCEAVPGYTPPVNALQGRCIQAEGSTSLYTATRIAIDALDNISEDNRIRALLLLSDGQDTCDAQGCSELRDVVGKLEATRDTLNPVLVIPIAYGSDADVATLNEIARASNTRVYSGSVGDINRLLTEISNFF